MAVPDTNTFSLGDVVSELSLGAGSSLGDCFAAASAASFDPTYEGAKDRLSNFRNYGADHLLVSPTAFDLGNSHPSQVVMVTTNLSWTATVTSGNDFINIVGGVGSGDGSFTANYTGDISAGRTGNIRVQVTGIERNIPVDEIM